MNLTLLSFTVVEAAANPLSRHGPEVSDFGDTLCVSPKTCSCWKSMLTAHFYLMNICFIKQKCVAQIKYLGSSRSMPTFFSGEICCRRNVNFVLLVQHIHPLGPRPSNPESL